MLTSEDGKKISNDEGGPDLQRTIEGNKKRT